VVVSLAATPPKKLFLVAGSQGNSISLALYYWQILLGGRPLRIIFLAVLLYSLPVFGRQGNSVLV